MEQQCTDMTREELEAKVKELCPEMLTHENFMHAADCMFCKDVHNDNRKALDDEELEAWTKLSETMHAVTVGQLVKYLKDNFKLDDKLCYMNCVEGCKNDCTYITKDQLGDRFFKYVKTLVHIDSYSYVNDNDVIIV